jgi:hypothetical protein
MKTNHFFWGIFLTTIGLLFLINNFSTINLDIDYFLRLWPLIIILIGLKLLVKNNIATNVIVFFSAVLLALIVYTFVFNPFSCGRIHIYRDMKKEKSETVSYFYSPKIKNANLNIEFDFGKMKIDNVTEKLINGEIRYRANEYKFDGEISDTIAFFFLNSESSKKDFTFVLPSKSNKNYLDLQLNQNPIWDIKINTNISDFDLNLSSLKSKELKFESNFSNGKLKLGKPLNESVIYLDINFSNLEIDYPDEAAIEVITDKNLSSIDINGLEKIEKNIYRSKNFDKSSNHFVVEISSNFSSVTIH